VLATRPPVETDSMHNQNTESHVLVIYDSPEPRQVLLKAATYSIGRDKRNSIVIPNRAISRQHALLLRMPLPDQRTYRYRILDGNISGQASLNGISVNGTAHSIYDLQPGDTILLGGSVRAEYAIMQLPSDGKYFDYLHFQTPEYQSLKVKPLSASATLVSVAECPMDTAVEENNFLTLEDFDDDIPPTELFSKD
jgi:pSer/pThr/pTyr-binding forkhead associated (FHA) protein